MARRTLRSNNLVLWVEDEMDTAREIADSLSNRLDIRVFGGKSVGEVRARVKRAVSEKRPVVVFIIGRQVPDLDELRKIIMDFRPKGVVSDLELGDDSLGGFSVLSAAADADRNVFLGLYTGRSDASIERLARALHVDAVVLKGHRERGLFDLAYKLFPEHVPARKGEIPYGSELAELIERNRLLENKCKCLRRELRSLRSGVKHRRPIKGEADKKRDKTVKELREKLGCLEKERKMFFAHQHDLVSTSGLVTKSLQAISSKPELIPAIIQDELRKAGIAAKHFSILVESMHDITVGGRPGKGSAGNIARSFREAREILERKIPDSINVAVEIPEDLPLSVIPDTLIVRCAINLLLNSLDAIPNRGHIEVKSSKETRTKGKNVEVVVQDTGRGILKRDLGKVFNWDFSTKGRPCGMGLFIVKMIMDQYGGNVEIESKRGKGTSVRLKIPAA